MSNGGKHEYRPTTPFAEHNHVTTEQVDFDWLIDWIIKVNFIWLINWIIKVDFNWSINFTIEVNFN